MADIKATVTLTIESEDGGVETMVLGADQGRPSTVIRNVKTAAATQFEAVQVRYERILE